MSRLKSIRLPFSANIKLALVLFALVIVGGTLLYTQRIVEDLKQTERETANFYAKLFAVSANAGGDGDPQSSTNALLELYWEVAQSDMIDFPMIITDEVGLPQVSPATGEIYDEAIRHVEYDRDATPAEQMNELKMRLNDMAATYEPLPIYMVFDGDSVIINYVYYGESATIQQLRWLPWIEILIGSMFVFVGYLSFSHIKRNEQSNIWVGMAKETAHQLGTPLSSLLGWIELLRLMPEDTDQVVEAADEMEHDVQRLNKVAQRFSKIGSAAELRVIELNEMIRTVIGYFDRRLPHLGKTVTLTLESSGPVYAAINVDLFEWVLENLIRNAADAIDRNDGAIRMVLSERRGDVILDVSDNGKGIDPKIRKDIFRPGFSTKTRGWGLGLSLAKRIVEEYHGGRIDVKESSSNGTTFRILLSAAQTDEGGDRRLGAFEAAHPAHVAPRSSGHDRSTVSDNASSGGA